MYDFLILRRKDDERKFNLDEWEVKTKSHLLYKYSFLIVDWFDYPDDSAHTLTSLAENRKLLIQRVYSQAKVILTDRLHASILAVLMGKPHVILDEKYKKISNTRKTAFEPHKECSHETLKSWYAKDIDDAILQGIQVLNNIQKPRVPKRYALYEFGYLK